jgi:hypothetical protein
MLTLLVRLSYDVTAPADPSVTDDDNVKSSEYVTKRDHLEDVRAAAKGAARARAELHKVIRRAVRAGESLRDVADAAGLSHEHVRRIARGDY